MLLIGNPPTPPKEITRDSVEGFGWEVRGSLSTYYSVFSSRTLRACPLEGQRICGKRGPAQTQSFVWVRTGQDRTGPAFLVVGWRETHRATVCCHSWLCGQMGYHCAFSAGLVTCLWCVFSVRQSQQSGRDVSNVALEQLW